MTDASAREFALGHGLTSTTRPLPEDAALHCAHLAREVRRDQDRRIALGHEPDAVALLGAAYLDLAERILGDVAKHRRAVWETIKAEERRLEEEEKAEEARRARGREWAKRRAAEKEGKEAAAARAADDAAASAAEMAAIEAAELEQEYAAHG